MGDSGELTPGESTPGESTSEASVLLLFAHPSQDRSEINRPLFEAAQQLPGVSCVDLYAQYPDMHIDIEREQARLLAHQHIVMLFPMYWYSTPALLKEWQDLVLEYGFAYGAEGTALRGKSLLCATSAGGGKEAYCQQGSNRFSLRELLRPLEQTANLCGMHYLPPFVLFASRTALEQQRLPAHVVQWQQCLQQLVATADIPAAWLQRELWLDGAGENGAA